MSTQLKHRAETVTAKPNPDIRARYLDAIEQMLTHRGNPSVEVEHILADAPKSPTQNFVKDCRAFAA
jgi:hypothetical protein